MEIRRSYDRLISPMGFPRLVRRHLYIESAPSWIFQENKVSNMAADVLVLCSTLWASADMVLTRSDKQVLSFHEYCLGLPMYSQVARHDKKKYAHLFLGFLQIIWVHDRLTLQGRDKMMATILQWHVQMIVKFWLTFHWNSFLKLYLT